MVVEAGANSSLRVRFCPRGHDKELTGKTPYNSCRACDRERATERTKQRRELRRKLGLTVSLSVVEKRDREARSGGFKYAFHLPAAPLNDAVEAWLKRNGNLSATTKRGGIVYRSPLHLLAHLYATRFGGSEASALRFLNRLSVQKTVTIEQADRYSILIGLHPAMVWPREWGESA